MSKVATLCHYTIDTGHTRESPRAEVADVAITQLAPLLVAGDHPMPGPTGYRVRTMIDGGTLYATVSRAGGGDLVSVIVCTDAATAGRAADGAKLRAPCCLVKLHLGLARQPAAAGWLGDFERCLAWAWIERCELGGAETVPIKVAR